MFNAEDFMREQKRNRSLFWALLAFGMIGFVTNVVERRFPIPLRQPIPSLIWGAVIAYSIRCYWRGYARLPVTEVLRYIVENRVQSVADVVSGMNIDPSIAHRCMDRLIDRGYVNVGRGSEPTVVIAGAAVGHQDLIDDHAGTAIGLLLAGAAMGFFGRDYVSPSESQDRLILPSHAGSQLCEETIDADRTWNLSFDQRGALVITEFTRDGAHAEVFRAK